MTVFKFNDMDVIKTTQNGYANDSQVYVVYLWAFSKARVVSDHLKLAIVTKIYSLQNKK